VDQAPLETIYNLAWALVTKTLDGLTQLPLPLFGNIQVRELVLNLGTHSA
jgi:hypothetical protein